MWRDGKGNLWTEGGKWLGSGDAPKPVPSQTYTSSRDRLLRASAAAHAAGLVLFLLSVAALLAIGEALR